jgi:hypothetical protein
MPRFELKKSIEVTKMNKRTGMPTGELATTIPFGAIIDDPELAWDYGKFTFQGQLYRCASDVLQAAMEKQPVAIATPAPATAVAPAVPAAAEPAPSAPQAPGLKWEALRSNPAALRAKVPGGWLVTVYSSVAFYPDPDHAWDGASLP